MSLTDDTACADERVFNAFSAALSGAEKSETPYRHWVLRDMFPADILAALQSVEFPLQALDGVSGKREYHNDSRHYFDQNNISAFPVAKTIAEAFQAPQTVRAIVGFFGVELEDTFLRLEYAQDTTGFWLQPHTDLGVKRITILIYLSDGDGHEDLGTDIYASESEWAGRSPFAPGAAMAFVPSANTYHGFEKRPINGVRKSLILNYVTKDWRDREQLCFPDRTVRAI